MKAIVLCAGYGTRLGSLTRGRPKVMLPIQGKPLLAYTLKFLAAEGLREVAINLHYRPEEIQAFCGDGSRFGLRIHYVHEDNLLGTAGAVKNLEDWVGRSESFLVLYGDILTDQPLKPLRERHFNRGALATLLLHQRAGSNSFVRMEKDHRITRFVERPKKISPELHAHTWVNSGVQILHPRILGLIPPGTCSDLPRDVYTKVVKQEKLFGVPLTGYRCAIDGADRYQEAREAVISGIYRYGETNTQVAEAEGGMP